MRLLLFLTLPAALALDSVDEFLRRIDKRQVLDNQGSNPDVQPDISNSVFTANIGREWSAPYLGGNQDGRGSAEALYAFGPAFGDRALSITEQNGEGKLADFSIVKSLGQGFPYYGGVYNYTWITNHGYISFAQAATTGPLLTLGDEVPWPQTPDPAIIGPYICPQVPNPLSRSLKRRRLGLFSLWETRFLGHRHPIQPSSDPTSAPRYRIPYLVRSSGDDWASSHFGRRGALATDSRSSHHRTLHLPPGVYYRLVVRDENIFQVANDPRYNFIVADNQFRGTGGPGNGFLDTVTRHLREGIVGAQSFRAEVALVVTWHLTISNNIQNINPSDLSVASTYQMVWVTDSETQVSYVLFNYHRLGFASADLNGNNKLARCRALFNGGNHTGQVPVLPGPEVKDNPISLAQLSAVPPKYRGRYLFRVDDVVLRGGCSNKTEGTVPILVTPDVVGMVGKTTVDVNGMCWVDRTQTFALYIEGQKDGGPCQRINAAISRCPLPPLQGWGTKNVYHQPMHSLEQANRAYVGFLYVAPPGQDPTRLAIGSIPQWYASPFQYNSRALVLSWFPMNYTNDMNDAFFRQSDLQQRNDEDQFSEEFIRQNIAQSLDLLVFGYREAADAKIRQWNPEHKLLAVLKRNINNLQGGNTIMELNRMREERIFDTSLQVDWCITPEERRRLIYNYRVGYLQLTPSSGRGGGGVAGSGGDGNLGVCDGGTDARRYGQVSDPISLHWLWPFNYQEGLTGSAAPFNPLTESLERIERETDRIASDMCMDWYNEDGMVDQYFIKVTESNSSCPCRVEYARADLGRFMPHPRCSIAFRSISCAISLGSTECFLSATNAKIIDYYSGASQSSKHGQVCCYDERGYLMHSNYQTVVQTNREFPYNPGFPTRAYEFGSEPYTGMFMVPTFSTMTHDVLPYFLCCRYSRERCQLFYWRRPSSGCQEYQEPVTAQIVGAGHFTTMTKRVFTFSGNGVYRLLSIPQAGGKKPIEIQVRMEPFPDRTVKYSIVQQEFLVQPSNASVVTGVAIGGGDIDHCQVTVRKDTRRYKYRTNVVVRGKLRYFDHMWLQRFNGLLIYLNNVRQGKMSEIYVVIQDSQVGLRIRESFGEDFDTPEQYRESYGLLDVTVSAGSEDVLAAAKDDYVRNQDPVIQARVRREPPTGLLLDRNLGGSELRFYGDQFDRAGIRQVILPTIDERYVVTDYSTYNRFAAPRFSGADYFVITQEDDARQYPAYPLFSKRAYAMSNDFMHSWRPPQDFQAFIEQQILMCRQRMNTLGAIGNSNLAQRQEIQRISAQCRVFDSQIDSACKASSNEICRFDMASLYEARIAQRSQQFQVTFEEDLAKIQLHYNSCAAMNIEFPEYLRVTDASAPKYLVDNTIEFGCYQNAWIKGTVKYECRQYIENDGTYVNRWNQGWQPWCRSREQTRTFKVLAAIFGTLLCILAIMAVFCCCWCQKTRRRESGRSRASSAVMKRPAQNIPIRDFGNGRNAAPLGQKVALTDYPSRPSTVAYEPRAASGGFPQYDVTPGSQSGFPPVAVMSRSRGSSVQDGLPNAPQDSPHSKNSRLGHETGV